jgi:hypothetical protein
LLCHAVGIFARAGKFLGYYQQIRQATAKILIHHSRSRGRTGNSFWAGRKYTMNNKFYLEAHEVSRQWAAWPPAGGDSPTGEHKEKNDYDFTFAIIICLFHIFVILVNFVVQIKINMK